MTALLLVSALLLVEPVAGPPECQLDADCVVTTFAGCCGSCCPQTRAAGKSQLEERQKMCAVIDCARPRCDRDREACRPQPMPANVVAVCRGSRCQLEPRRAPAPECRVDADCAVSWTPGPDDPCREGPCGCCPAAPRAVAVDAERRKPAPLPPLPREGTRLGADPAPTFGLSQGKVAPPAPPVACSPCRGPRPATAVCRAGRCGLAPQPRALPR